MTLDSLTVLQLLENVIKVKMTHCANCSYKLQAFSGECVRNLPQLVREWQLNFVVAMAAWEVDGVIGVAKG